MRYGIAPRELSLWRRYRFPRIQRPDYLPKGGKDALNQLLDAQETLIKRGVVRMGTLIQVNRLLFKKGDQDHPGELLVCPDADTPPGELLDIASKAYDRKGAPDPDDPDLAGHLENQLTRVFGMRIAPSITGGRTAYCSTTIFRRESFPDSIIRGRLFPILVDPQTYMAMVLPHPYWTPESHAIYESTI